MDMPYYKTKRGKDTRNRAEEKRRAYHKANPLVAQIRAANMRAKRLGIPHGITLGDLSPLPKYCPVLGTPLAYVSGTRKESRNPNRATLDRLDNDKGYVKGNVFVISWRANKLKADATLDEVLHLARYMMPGAPK